MRKLYVSTALTLALALALAGCKKQPEDQVVDLSRPEAAPAPTAAVEELGELGYAADRVEVFFPEDAGEATALYKLSYSAPVFGREATDEAVNRYLDELYTRVTEERMPLADRVEGEALPATTVEFTVRQAALPQGMYTSIIFTETATYGGASPEERSIYTIVCDPEGRECSLAAVSGNYSPYDTVAQQVWNIIDREPDAYYGDVTIESIAPVLDLYNGFTVAEEGYAVFVPAGALADESRGILEFSFARSAMYPGFVGDLVSDIEYERFLPQLNAAAGACGPGFASFAGAPRGALGMAFMRDYMLNGRSAAQVGLGELNLAYEGLFGQSIAPESVPGAEIGGDTVSLAAQPPAYRFQCQDAYLNQASGGAPGHLAVTGEVVIIEPGSGEVADVAATATATLEYRGPAVGWAVTSFGTD